MKFRSGLVSNSSSCSFTLYGFAATDEEFANLMLKTEKGKAALKENEMLDENGDLKDTRDAADILPDIEYGNPDRDDNRYFGKNLYTMNGNQTRDEFYAEVENLVREWLGDTAANNCTVHSDSWYNG